MKNHKKEELLQKYLEGNATVEEQAIVESWQLNFSLDDRAVLNDVEIAEDLDEIRTKLIMLSGKIKDPYVLWSRVMAAASIVIITGVAIWLLNSNRHELNDHKPKIAHHNIAPGKNRATIKLANGKIINLNDNKTGIVIEDTKLTYNDGTEISVDPNVSGEQDYGYNIVSTPKGGQYQIVLFDGTKVWLNAASSLKYPSKFTNKERVVELEGEAYFEVSHNAKIPFRVKSNNQLITVLGTHFNVNAYRDAESTKTTLIEGSVKVEVPFINQNVILKAGKQSILTGRQIDVQNANVKRITAWKDGFFSFEDEDINVIMKSLERWYNIDVEFREPIGNKRFSLYVSKSKNISEILNLMQATKSINFKIEGRRVIVMK